MFLPSRWTAPGPIMVRRFVRHTKNDPLIDKVKLSESLVYIRYHNGRESTVSLKDLAPCPQTDLSSEEDTHIDTGNTNWEKFESNIL